MSRIPLNDLLKIAPLDTLVGSEELETTAQTVTGAVNELNDAIEDIETENDSWTNESQVYAASGHKWVTFDNLNGEYGYALYCRNYLASVMSMAIANGTTEGTKKITYMLDDGINTGEYCKLRIIR